MGPSPQFDPPCTLCQHFGYIILHVLHKNMFQEPMTYARTPLSEGHSAPHQKHVESGVRHGLHSPPLPYPRPH